VQNGEAPASRSIKDKDALRDGNERAVFDADSDGMPSGRRSRKISEPLSRAPRSSTVGAKSAGRSAGASKAKEKSRKNRR
ncbi:MAG TPA: hypothetical protein VIM63_05965, partial [Rhodoferax sp.]